MQQRLSVRHAIARDRASGARTFCARVQGVHVRAPLGAVRVIRLLTTNLYAFMAILYPFFLFERREIKEKTETAIEVCGQGPEHPL